MPASNEARSLGSIQPPAESDTNRNGFGASGARSESHRQTNRCDLNPPCQWLDVPGFEHGPLGAGRRRRRAARTRRAVQCALHAFARRCGHKHNPGVWPMQAGCAGLGADQRQTRQHQGCGAGTAAADAIRPRHAAFFRTSAGTSCVRAAYESAGRPPGSRTSTTAGP